MSFGQSPVFGSQIFKPPFGPEDEDIIPDPGETFFMLFEDGFAMLFESAMDNMLYENAPP